MLNTTPDSYMGRTVTETGYVLIHRSLIGHPDFRSDAEAMAFAWLIMKAAWRPVRVRYKGKSIELQRGQLAVSLRDMATALDRSKTWVERFLSRLKTGTMIETEAGTASAIITICNYDKFQVISKAPETTPGQQAGQHRDSTGTQNKEGNKGIKVSSSEETKARARKRPEKSAWKLPDDIPAEAWAGFEEMRKKEGKPLTDYARNLGVKKLQVMRQEGHDIVAVIEQSIFKAWSGFFPVKGQDNENYRNGSNGRDEGGDGFDRALRRAIRQTSGDADEFGGSLFPDGMG